ncbi:MAG TPA: MFS transporter [Candidatus Binatia bacterium]
MRPDAASPTALDARALAWGLVAVAVAVVLGVLGSGGLRWFDAALAGYLLGTLFAIFGTVYRYAVWLQRPPTARLHRQSWRAFRAGGFASVKHLASLVVTNLLGQTFIAHRSRLRWIAHQLVFWGCVLAAAITFPLVFGWLHFESVGQDAARYRAFVGPWATIDFDATSVLGWLMFHGLDVAAVLVLAGVFLFLGRRVRDPGALAVERSTDFLALAGLFAVSVTGLMLTVSTLWMGGRFYAFLTTVHALTVILGLMYIPFGKLFHIFQRPANLGVQFYKRAAAAGPQQRCTECGDAFASAMQVRDLKEVLPQVGFDYALEGGGSYQDVCPACRRRLVTLAQSRRVGGFG